MLPPSFRGAPTRPGNHWMDLRLVGELQNNTGANDLGEPLEMNRRWGGVGTGSHGKSVKV